MIHREYRREPPEFALFPFLNTDGSIPYDLVMHGARISLPILFNSGTLYISMARGRIWKFESASEVAKALFARSLEKDTPLNEAWAQIYSLYTGRFGSLTRKSIYGFSVISAVRH